MTAFKFSAVRTSNNNPSFRDADAWTVRIINPRGERLQSTYYMGSGHKGATPTLEQVLESLILDAGCANACDTLDDFAREYGYDSTAEARSAYKACKRTAERLETFLTPEERERYESE